MMRYFSFLLLFLGSVTVMAQSTVESIPNQKLINGSYVSNPNKILDDATVRQIDTLLTSLEKKTSAQVAVVVVKSIGDEDIVEFAQKLFDSWGIGSKGNDNGLLVLFVDDKHTVRFHTGYGLEGMLPDIACKRIQREYMVPEFKNGNYNTGMLMGLQQVHNVLTDPKYAEEIKKPDESETSDWIGFVIFLAIFIAPVILILFIVKATNGRFADSKNPEDTLYPELRMKRWNWLLMAAGLPVLIIILFGISPMETPTAWGFTTLYLYFMGTRFHRLWRMNNVIKRFLKTQDYYEIVEFVRKQQWYWFFMALLFPLPFLFYFFYHVTLKKRYRNYPRTCKKCSRDMRKLSEKDEDEFLSKEMQMEETLRAVDYDVWKCKECNSIEMSFYLNRHSKYDSCPKCKTMAYYSTGRRTVDHATYSSSGTGEETHACKFCGYNHKSSYTIARLTRSTSASTAGSSFGSSSSSSGGSWGGGRSGGGGASSSW